MDADVGVPFKVTDAVSSEVDRDVSTLDISAEVLFEAMPLPRTLSTGAGRMDLGGDAVI